MVNQKNVPNFRPHTQNKSTFMKTLLKGGKWPYYKVILACLLTGAFSFAISHQFHKTPPTPTANPPAGKQLVLTRLKDYKFIQPLLLSDMTDPDPGMNGLMTEIESTISSYHQKDTAYRASVYIRDLNDARWNVLNQEEKYDPGSILKLPIMIALMKKAESDPGILEQQILYQGTERKLPTQTIKPTSIQPGTVYKVKDLLQFMIVESDNEANMLLFNFLKPEVVLKVFRDLNMEVPDVSQPTVYMKAADVSKFLRIIYNSSYTNPRLSEYAMELLEKTKFKDGMKKSIPGDALLVHKFGERGYPGTSYQELCETGIIYLNDQRVLLTIMTKGNNQRDQAASISEITRKVVNRMQSSNL